MNSTADVLALFIGQNVTLRTRAGVEMDFDVTEAEEVTREVEGSKSKRIQLIAVSTSAPRMARL